MQVHTFRAESLQAALQQVRHTLGPDASILHTRETRPGRLGLFSRRVIEVEATLEQAHTGSSPSPMPAHGTDPAVATSMQQTIAQPALTQQTIAGSGTQAEPKVEPKVEPRSDSVAPAAQPGVPATPATPSLVHASASRLEVQAELLAGGVPAQIVGHLLSEVERLGDPQQREDIWAIRGRIGQIVGSKLKVSGSIELNRRHPQRPAVVALVGPTGVGKTTTLAKIAAGFRFDLGCRVGLIALDTFRLGAVDQLLQYAELISAPLEVVSAAEQVTPALERLQDCDLVLLDTAGRGPRDVDQLLELQKFLQLAQPEATQLVVSATSSIAYVAETLQRFEVLRPTNLLITKIDETVGFGSWLQLLQACPLPISYLTTGQHVPQDIVVASARRLTSLLLGTG